MRKLLWMLSILIPITANASSTFTTHYNLEKARDGSTNWGASIRDALDTIDSQLFMNATGVSDHEAETVGAHAATAISTSPSASTCTTQINVQDFLECLVAAVENVGGGGAGNGAYTVYGSEASPLTINEAAGVTVSIAQRQQRFIVSNGGALAMTAPSQILSGTTVGQELTLFGTSDTDYNIFHDGDGMSINGIWLSKSDRAINLSWTGIRWREQSRN